MLQLDIRFAVWKEKGWYVARALTIEVASQGRTKESAIKNLYEAVGLLFENEKYLRSSE